jgi:hypothetical protein
VSLISDHAPPRSANQHTRRPSAGWSPGGPRVNSKAALGLTAGALALGLIAGLALGGDGDSKAEKATGPGPTKTVAGVPVGYEHSKAGAIQAALAYQSALGRLARPTEPATAVIEAIAAPSDRQSITDSLTPGLELVRKALGGDGFVQSASVGYQLKDYRGDAADVVIWGVSVLKQAGSAGPQSGWTTTTLRLKWSNGDWKLSGPPEGTDGPTPALRDAPSDPGPLTTFASSLKEASDAPDE